MLDLGLAWELGQHAQGGKRDEARRIVNRVEARGSSRCCCLARYRGRHGGAALDEDGRAVTGSGEAGSAGWGGGGPRNKAGQRLWWSEEASARP